MPLYKKSSPKAKVKTQNSFISPLISKNKVNNLIGDDYTKNIPIPIKNNLLEPLINISKEGQLLDQLEKKSFKDTNRTVIEVTKTKETWTDANQRRKSKKHLTDKSKKLSHDSLKRNGVFSKPTRSKALNKTLSDIRTQSPPLFDSPSSTPVNNKRLKKEQSMVITTEIKFTSNTDKDMFKMQKEVETPNSSISNIVNDCVMNNIKMSQEIWNQNASAMSTKTLSNTDENTNDKQMEDDESELHASLKSILDDIVQTNECLSQNLFDGDDDFEMEDTNKQYEKDVRKDSNMKENKNDLGKRKKESKETEKPKKRELDDSLQSILDTVVQTNERLSQNLFGKDDGFEMKDTSKPRKKNVGRDLITKKTKSKNRSSVVKREKECKENREPDKCEVDVSLKTVLDDIVQTNERLSQNLFGKDDGEIKNTNKQYKKDVRKDLNTKKNKPKNRNDLVKRAKDSKENEESKKIKKTVSPDRIDKLPDTTINNNSASLKKVGENLKQKNKSKYLIEKNKTRKNKNEGIKSNEILNKKVQKNNKKSASNDLVENTEKNEDRKLNKKKSFTIAKRSSGFFDEDSQNKDDVDNKLKNKKENGPPKPSNMIFTSKDAKTIDEKINELFELQDKRNVGLYVYCDSCDKVRHLPDCKDPLDLPAKWYCYMNSDQNYNKCSDPEYHIDAEEENLLIFNKFNAGSIVWAKMDGYPWWPAMVDDDPDLTDYFWLDDMNNPEPSWYHVTFFDSCDVTRAWIRTASLEPFEENSTNKLFRPNKYDRYKHRVNFAIKEAKTACKKSLLDRLRLYSFASRYLKKKQQKTSKDSTKIGEKSKKNYNMKKFCKDLLSNSNGAAKQHKNKSFLSFEGCDDGNEMFDDLSISSSQISTILKPGGFGGNNRIGSDDDVLENINLDHFI